MDTKTQKFINNCVNQATDMTTICQPLNNIGIDHLSYTRVYNNGERVYLVSKPIIVVDFFAKKKYLKCDNEKHPDYYHEKEIQVWSTLPNQKVYHEAKLMGAGHGIYYFDQKGEDYCDSFGFATSTHNETILNSYFTNLDLIKKFVKYFRRDAASILHQAERHKIILPLNEDTTSYLYRSEKLKLFLMSENPSEKLTPRQLECTHLVMKGMSAKQIADELKISPRTVEIYLNEIKRRLRCKSRTELIIKLVRLLDE